MLTYMNDGPAVRDGFNYIDDGSDVTVQKCLKWIFTSMHQEQHYKIDGNRGLSPDFGHKHKINND